MSLKIFAPSFITSFYLFIYFCSFYFFCFFIFCFFFIFIFFYRQVLSDDVLRSNYDHGGRDGVEGAPKMDSSALFAMIFGSEKFEPLVGKYGYVYEHLKNSIIIICVY